MRTPVQRCRLPAPDAASDAETRRLDPDLACPLPSRDTVLGKRRRQAGHGSVGPAPGSAVKFTIRGALFATNVGTSPLRPRPLDRLTKASSAFPTYEASDAAVAAAIAA
jgi:hypothetical protein